MTLVSLLSGTAKAVKMASDAALSVVNLRRATTASSKEQQGAGAADVDNNGTQHALRVAKGEEVAVTNLSDRTIRLQVDADRDQGAGAGAGDIGFSRLLETKEKTGCFRHCPARAYIDGRPVGSLNPGSIYIFDVDEVLREYVNGKDQMLYEKDPRTGELFADALDGSSNKPCLGELPGPQHRLLPNH